MYGQPAPASYQPQGMPPQQMAAYGQPMPVGAPMQQFGAPQQMMPQAMPPQQMPPQVMAPQQMPPQAMHPQAMPMQQMPPQAMFQQQMPPQAMPMQQMPPQAMPLQTTMPQQMPQGMQPMQQFSGQPQQFAAMPQAMPGQGMQQPPPMDPASHPLAINAGDAAPPLPEPTMRAYAPAGGELLQIMVMGTKNLTGGSAVVHIQVAGKHDFQVEAQPITGLVLQPKTTVTYIHPGDSLVFNVVDGGASLGSAQLGPQQFYPGGFEGDLPIGAGAVAVKISLLGAGGLNQVQPLAPVTVEHSRQAPAAVEMPPQVAGTTLRHCSPEEFQRAGAAAGGIGPKAMMADELAGQQVYGQAHHVLAQQPPPNAMMPQQQPTMMMPPQPMQQQPMYQQPMFGQ